MTMTVQYGRRRNGCQFEPPPGASGVGSDGGAIASIRRGILRFPATGEAQRAGEMLVGPVRARTAQGRIQEPRRAKERVGPVRILFRPFRAPLPAHCCPGACTPGQLLVGPPGLSRLQPRLDAMALATRDFGVTRCRSLWYTVAGQVNGAIAEAA